MHIFFSSFNTAHTARNCLKEIQLEGADVLSAWQNPVNQRGSMLIMDRSVGVIQKLSRPSDTLSSLVYRSSIWPALQTGLSTSRQRQLTHILRNYDSLVMCRLLNQCQSGVWSLPVPPTLCHGRTFPAQTFLIRHLRTGWSPDLGGYLLKHIDRLPPDPWHHVRVEENDDHNFVWRFRPLILQEFYSTSFLSRFISVDFIFMISINSPSWSVNMWLETQIGSLVQQLNPGCRCGDTSLCLANESHIILFSLLWLDITQKHPQSNLHQLCSYPNSLHLLREAVRLVGGKDAVVSGHLKVYSS